VGRAPSGRNAFSLCGRPRSLKRAQETPLTGSPSPYDAALKEAAALDRAGKLSEAEARYRAILGADPNHIDAVQGLTRIQFQSGRFEDALAAIDRALKAHGQRADLWSNRGACLAAMKRFEDAVASLDQSLRLNGSFGGARLNRANALLELGRYPEAARDYESVLRTNPDISSALGGLLRCKIQICDWKDLDAHWNRALADLRSERSAIPPMVITALGSTAEDQFRNSRILARRYFANRPSIWQGERYGHTRIRIAYVSADFHAHATATLTAGLFEEHDRRRFETYAISFGPDDGSPMRRRLEAAFTRFLHMPNASDETIARTLKDLEIDIAIDLKGLTPNARPGIFARRPAPVQVSYLGYPGTMGAPYIDYLIADSIVIPPEHSSHYSEAIVRLPESYQPNDLRRQIAAVRPTRRELGLPETAFVYCCFNNPYKITREIFALWMRLLSEIEGSALWLLEDSPTVMDNLRREGASRGVSPERLLFAPRIAPEEHLARHSVADLFLDTLPYNAHTTASDALFAGLPLLTCIGSTFPGRVAASLLETMGPQELIVTSLDDYHSLGLKLARDPAALKALREKLASNRNSSPLFDTKRYARHLEAAYLDMVQRHRRGDKPEAFEVAPIGGSVPG
jgi:predicted O-linked N-acetylglucosamine transferase (SPINDLY family)